MLKLLVAAAAVIGVGGWMLFAGEEGEEDKAARITTSRGLALVGLGISISLDELAIGFSIGLSSLPVIAVIVAIALRAFIAAQAGLAVGAKIAARWRERAERGQRDAAQEDDADGRQAQQRPGGRARRGCASPARPARSSRACGTGRRTIIPPRRPPADNSKRRGAQVGGSAGRRERR